MGNVRSTLGPLSPASHQAQPVAAGATAAPRQAAQIATPVPAKLPASDVFSTVASFLTSSGDIAKFKAVSRMFYRACHRGRRDSVRYLVDLDYFDNSSIEIWQHFDVISCIRRVEFASIFNIDTTRKMTVLTSLLSLKMSRHQQLEVTSWRSLTRIEKLELYYDVGHVVRPTDRSFSGDGIPWHQFSSVSFGFSGTTDDAIIDLLPAATRICDLCIEEPCEINNGLLTRLLAASSLPSLTSLRFGRARPFPWDAIVPILIQRYASTLRSLRVQSALVFQERRGQSSSPVLSSLTHLEELVLPMCSAQVLSVAFFPLPESLTSLSIYNIDDECCSRLCRQTRLRSLTLTSLNMSLPSPTTFARTLRSLTNLTSIDFARDDTMDEVVAGPKFVERNLTHLVEQKQFDTDLRIKFRSWKREWGSRILVRYDWYKIIDDGWESWHELLCARMPASLEYTAADGKYWLECAVDGGPGRISININVYSMQTLLKIIAVLHEQ
jgi:hypothetical protein